MKKFLLACIPLIGIFLFYADASASSNVTVKITERGFEPESVTVKSGDSVTWVNEDSAQHWPASNPHPVHTGYPSDVRGCIGSSFDVCHGMNRGESYTFVFEKIGTWGAHDHLNPGELMQIKVLGRGEQPWWVRFEELMQGKFFDLERWMGIAWSGIWHQDPSAPALAGFLQMDMDDQTKIIKNLAAQDPPFAWKYLKQAYQRNGQVTGNVHSLAHVVGNGAYMSLGIAGVKVCDISFSYGCLHGVSEKALQDKGPVAVTEVEKECVITLKDAAQDEVSGCMHGMGHGLLTWEKLDVGKALADCDRLAYRWENYCYDGVFMENAADSPTWYQAGGNYWKFCGELQTKYQFNCARYEAVGLSNTPNLGIREIAIICEQAPVASLIKPCLDSLGFKAAQDNTGNLDGIKAECLGLAGTEAEDECLASAATEAKFQQYNNWEKVSNGLCAAVSESNRANCMKQAVAN